MSSWNKINTSAVALRLAQCQENFLQNICFAVCGIFECLAAQSTMTNPNSNRECNAAITH